LTLKDSFYIHFKQSNHQKSCCYFFLFLLDFILAIVFQLMHMYFFTVAEFEDEDNHVLHILIGAGFTGIILFYSFSDGVRFLRSNVDKFLYLISCLLQKPLLLPILMPSRFRSRIAIKHISNYTVNIEQHIEVDGKMINNTKRI